MKRNRTTPLVLALLAGLTAVARAQMPADSVDLAKVLITEHIKSDEFCPIALKEAAADGPTWEHAGVKYRGSSPEAKAEFMKDPDAHAKAAAEARYVENYVRSMSRVWCPVTDEVNPGGLLQWEVEGITWESCCAFCDQSVADQDFVDGLERLKMRAKKSFALAGGKYTEGEVVDPIAGAIKSPGGGSSEPAAAGGDAPAPAAEPAWLRNADLKPTWNEGVGLVFDNRCLNCHRPGGSAPMPFDSYNSVRRWTKSLKATVSKGSMPPWPADPGVGHFGNSRALTDREMTLIMDWADAGYPKGEGSFKSSKALAEWWIGTPDATFQTPKYTIGTDVTEEIKEFTIQTDFPEDKWIAAAEIHPSNEFSLVHIQAGPLGAWYPSNYYVELPEGMAYHLKKGEAVKVRVFYKKEKGFPIDDYGNTIAIRFADPASVTTKVMLDPAEMNDFTIAPGEEGKDVVNTWIAPSDVRIASLTPVLLRRAKSVSYTAETPDGKKTELLRISNWNPDVKYDYQLSTPFDAPKGTKIEIRAVFDNSKLNAKNPDPSATVTGGVGGGEIFQGGIGYGTGK